MYRYTHTLTYICTYTLLNSIISESDTMLVIMTNISAATAKLFGIAIETLLIF